MPLTRLHFTSLRTRFMALAVLLTLATSAIWGGWTWTREQKLLHQSLSREGEILVSSMAIPIINALLYEELGIVREGGLLDNFVADIMANRQFTPLYAMVLDQDGRVLAHNRFAEYGQVYQDELTRSALAANGYLERALHVDGEHSRDLAMPLAIAGKRWGCLRVGISLEPLRRDLNLLAGRIFLFSALFTFGALAVFFLVGSGLARPLMALAADMEGLDRTLAIPTPTAYRRDEIGQLQHSFQRMLERLRSSEAERQASVVRLLESERIATVGRIVSGVAHEVNNPLAGIEGALYQIEQKGGPPIQRYVDMIRKSVDRIGRIVGQLLDLSRVGRMEPERVGGRELFKELVLFARMAVKARQCRLETSDQSRTAELILDRDKIHQVVLNLLLNAADANGEGGKIQLRAFDTEDSYCLAVSDQGPGIPEDLRGQIFEPFFTTKAPGTGTGMGLAISRSIAESHGGTLEVWSELGEGATFILSLPLRPERSA
jgi:signal transduction histidine kinase